MECYIIKLKVTFDFYSLTWNEISVALVKVFKF